jgi:hypothetical protein
MHKVMKACTRQLLLSFFFMKILSHTQKIPSNPSKTTQLASVKTQKTETIEPP